MKLKKKLSVILTSLTLMTSSCSVSQVQFDTIRGKRDLADYTSFLRSRGLNISNLRASSEGEIVHIYEKKYEMYSANPQTSIQDILNEYCIDDIELRRIEYIKESRNFRDGEKIKVYKNIVHDFSLDELDSVSIYEYYVVQPFETIEDVSNNCGVSVETLKHNNPILYSNQIQEYMTLKIPKEKAKRKY